jgi:O-methyltransferase
MTMPFVEERVLSVLKWAYARWWFMRRSTAKDRRLREQLVQQFQRVERIVPCHHEQREMFVMVDYILNGAPEGPLVECGCYKGGSSAKLSLVAKAMGRRLWICDSFEGLPEVAGENTHFQDVRGVQRTFAAHEYVGNLREVQDNIGKAGGALGSCEFVKGYFSASLPNLDLAPAFVFADVDLVSSMRDVFQHLWPRMRPGARFYMHDVNLVGLVTGSLDPEFWVSRIGRYPPVVFGAGYGCGLWAGGIGYCEK